MKVLIACEYSGTVRDAFIAKGHDAWSCDLLPTEKPGPHWEGDIFECLKFFRYDFDLMIGFPPCTDLAVSGAKHFIEKKKDGRQKRAIDFFIDLYNSPLEKICLENPIGIMSSVFRRPNQIIQPWMYGHGETKSTCLWLKKLPRLNGTKIVSGREQRIHKLSALNGPGSSKYRQKERSKTYQGIADAMANQWG